MTGSSLKLLLVDHDLDFAKYVGATMTGSKSCAIEVEHLSDFDAARKMVAAGCHDAYLIDHSFDKSGHAGLDLIKYGRNVSLKPMIMLTSDTAEESGDLAISQGASDFLHKQHATIPILERMVRNSITRNDRIARLAQERDLLQHQLHHDQLTGVYSRIAIERHLDRAMRACQPEQVGVLMYLDLDHFKPVNDYYGHAAGDQVMKIVAHRISEAIRPGDYFGRMAGDEFLIVGPPSDSDIFTDGAVDTMLRNICLSVARPIQVYDVAGESVYVNISVSVGVVKFGVTDRNRDYLIALADKAMYVDKSRDAVSERLN